MKTLKYFSATWCGPCKSFKPIITEIANEGHSVQFIDIDQNSGAASKYNVMSVPTVVIEENGIELSRFIGTKSKQAILESIA
jgi:thioredoxin 1|tara:strand:- start:815 stop:1060 length:246 start_codon:yes stop_codon:yes gene_type:complete